MDYTLEHIALMKVAAILWNQKDIRSLILDFDTSAENRKIYEDWQKIENKAIENVPQLLIPTLLKEKLSCFIKITGLQILKWIQYHFVKKYFGKKLPNEFCWTSQGTIDRKKTALVLIEDESITDTTRFILACIYCLEENVFELWNKMPANDKKSFSNNKVEMSFIDQELVELWIHETKGEMVKMRKIIKRKYNLNCSPYRYIFQCAVHAGNKVATEHFLQKLTSLEKQSSLLTVAKYIVNDRVGRNTFPVPRKDFSDVFCFLLVHMDEEQKEELFQSCPFEVLECLLDWPWQKFFMESASLVMELLTDEEYFYLLKKISFRTIHGHKDWDYQELFKEFWQQSLDTHKRYVIDDQNRYYQILSNLFQVKDESNVKLIFQNATLIERYNFIVGLYGPLLCQELTKNDEYGLLKFFFNQCLSSNCEIVKFKSTYLDYLKIFYKKDELDEDQDKWRKAFHLLDICAREKNKRKSIKISSRVPAKRITR